MRKIAITLLILCTISCCFVGCSNNQPDIVASTLPVYDFTTFLCEGTNLNVELLVRESVSCLHDYTLQVYQMEMLESADVVIISGVGLEDFLNDAIANHNNILDSSRGCHIYAADDHGHDHKHDHNQELDPHIWLSPENAITMAQNICQGLSATYPHHAVQFATNLTALITQLNDLQAYGEQTLSSITCRDLITFHDGFRYFAKSFNLNILESIEEESGSEASAKELKELIQLIRNNHLPAVFTEVNGSVSAADIICAETDAKSFSLNMAMYGSGYFDAMYDNINTVKEALG